MESETTTSPSVLVAVYHVGDGISVNAGFAYNEVGSVSTGVNSLTVGASYVEGSVGRQC
jgi:hypothetical protein